MLYQYFPNLPSMGSLPDGCVLTHMMSYMTNRLCNRLGINPEAADALTFQVHHCHARCCAICLLVTHFHSPPFILVFIKPSDSPKTANMVTWLRGPIGRMVEILGCCSCFYSQPPSFCSTARIFPPPSSVPPPFTR